MAQDAVTVAPHAYKVMQENDRVRVLEFRGKPGDKTAMHSHPSAVGIAITDGKFRFTSPDGQSIEAELKAGQTIYHDVIEHTTEVLGTSEAHVVIVELKGPKPQ
jgi:quercetin dioxygenase-like cupin family protein